MEEDPGRGKDHSIIAAALIFLLLAAVFAVIISKQINLGKFTLPFYLMVVGMFFFATAMESQKGKSENGLLPWAGPLTCSASSFITSMQPETRKAESTSGRWFFPQE